MSKRLSDLSNDDLKKLAGDYLDILNVFAKNMMSVNQIGLQIYDTMKTLQINFKNNTLDLQPARKKLYEIMENVCLFIPDYEQKLRNFRELSVKLNLSHQDFFSEISKEEEKHKQVAEMTTILKKKENSKEYFYSLLHLQQNIRESIEHDFIESLKRAPDAENHDFEDLFSIGKKIPRGNGFVTQIVAMRHAISHIKYKIIQKDDTFQLIFNNTKDGFDYHDEYTLDEFWLFMNRQNNLITLFIIVAYVIYLDNLFKSVLT